MIHTIEKRIHKLWGEYAEIFPKLVKHDPPSIELNDRLYKTAGFCIVEDNHIVLSSAYLGQHPRYMLLTILPHEMAHSMDYILNGWYTRKHCHASPWKNIMVAIGQAPNPYHHMELK